MHYFFQSIVTSSVFECFSHNRIFTSCLQGYIWAWSSSSYLLSGHQWAEPELAEKDHKEQRDPPGALPAVQPLCPAPCHLLAQHRVPSHPTSVAAHHTACLRASAGAATLTTSLEESLLTLMLKWEPMFRQMLVECADLKCSESGFALIYLNTRRISVCSQSSYLTNTVCFHINVVDWYICG